MAIVKDTAHIQRANPASYAIFDTVWKAEDEPPFTGIYRCTGCGLEIVYSKGEKLPAPNHHPHTLQQGPPRWKLLVFCVQKQ